MWTVPLLRLETVARPRVGVAQIRQLARLCTILRWPGLLFGAIAGIVVPPPATVLLVLLIVWVAVYNSWGINMIPRASDGSILRIGRGLTLLDCLSYFWLLAIFPVVPPAVYAAFILLIVCLVAYDGAEGAMLSLAIFVIGMIGLQAVRVTFYHLAFNGTDVLHLSENTIKTHVENLLTRLNARNRAEAVATASRQNLI